MPTRNPAAPFVIGAQPESFNATAETVYAVVGEAFYDVGQYEVLTLHAIVHTQPSGTSPTLDVKLQDSPDKTNWADISGAAVAQFTGGTQSGCNRASVTSFGRWVRVMKKCGGTGTIGYSYSVFVSPRE